jgi:MFS family permease
MSTVEAGVTPPRGLGWILFGNLIIAVDYSMIMPTGWEYIENMGGSEFFYGLVVAAFPIGRVLCLLQVGAWSDRVGFRVPFACCFVLGLVGSVIYGLASSFGHCWIALLGRFVAGCGASQPLGAWAARAYPPEKRAQVQSMASGANLFGVVFGPAMNVAVASLNVKWGPVEVNPQTCAGYIPALLNLVCLIGFLVKVQEPPAEDAAQVTWARQWEQSKYMFSTGAWVLLLVALQANFQMACIDTVLAELTAKFLHWNLYENSAMFAIVAVIAFVGAVVAIVTTAGGKCPLRLIMAGLILNVILATSLMMTMRQAPDSVVMPAFLTLVGINTFSILLYNGPISGLYQQACGSAQGLLGGVFAMSFALGRPIGSILGGDLLDGHPLPTLVAMPTMVLVSFLLLSLVQRRLQRAHETAVAAQKAAPLVDQAASGQAEPEKV